MVASVPPIPTARPVHRFNDHAEPPGSPFLARVGLHFGSITLGRRYLLLVHGGCQNELMESQKRRERREKGSNIVQIQERGNIDTTVIVPAYNEEAGLPITLSKLFQQLDDSYEVIVVDDGSTDRTPKVAEAYPCRFIKHDFNLGKGEALRTGIRHARGDNVIWIDADDTYPVETIPKMAEALKEYDIVVGSRMSGNENMPAFNRFGNWVFRTMIRMIYGFRAHDPCTGLYGAKKSRLVQMELSAKGFAIEPEISIKSGRMKLRTLDIPLHYRPRIGETKLNAVRVGLEDLATILGLLLWRGNRRRLPPVNDASE